MMLAKKCAKLDKEARTILADLIPLVQDDRVAHDPEFLDRLNAALEEAKKAVQKDGNGRAP